MKGRAGKRSGLRAQERSAYRAEMAKLTPSARLRMGLDLSDFCLKLAAAGQKAIAHGSVGENHA